MTQNTSAGKGGRTLTSYQEVLDFVENNQRPAKQLIAGIDDLLVEARDAEGVPIYLTKGRVKSANSIYMKLKRKNYVSLQNLTDFSGLRVLCLFEEDILPVHRYIIKKLSEKDYQLVEFHMFNWNDKAKEDVFSTTVVETYSKIEPKIPETSSGYKSLHYLFQYRMGTKDYCIEIQLRTLFQDVWSELEHALAYKKSSTHPFIQKSFYLLSREIEVKDQQITHLKNIYDREKVGHRYTAEKAGPVSYFEYDNSMLPAFLREEGGAFDSFEQYINFMHEKDNLLDRSRVCQARELFEAVKNKIPYPDNIRDDKWLYIDKMELAYFDFWDGRYREALNCYNEIKEKYRSSYMCFFRIGELYFIDGNEPLALRNFDESIKLIKEARDPKPINEFRIKTKMAYIYWLMGQEYIKQCVDLIDEAEILFCRFIDQNEGADYYSLINNKAAYYLEKYLITNEEIDLDETRVLIEKLESQLSEELDNAHLFDTVAWFYFQVYKMKGGRENLEKAKKYCTYIGERKNYSSFRLASLNIHKNHIQEIMCME